jgi:hypothetical protein
MGDSVPRLIANEEVANRFLLSLGSEDFEWLSHHLRPVKLDVGQVFCWPEQPVHEIVSSIAGSFHS